ncbi:MAG: ATP-dependent DNA ligase [Candidatus Daviesbacteria bacterium]|nr:ATP-dependent DNA ligase [Candidatus Daviesbacteria bacterium]
MIFGKFAEYLEKLETTSSRLSLIDILADLFSEVKADEIAEVVYLIQGRVAPFYEPIEIGMSEKLVASAIAQAYGVSKEEVLQEYSKVGDLGKVTEKLAGPAMSSLRKQGSIKNPDGSRIPSASLRAGKSGMTVGTVSETLLEIAKISGNGTVEKRVNLLSDLLKQLDPVSAKHLVRIPMGASRLGVGDPTILEAFALAKLGDRKHRKVLEDAYNKTSDLGIIGQTLWKSGIKGIEKLDVEVGRPLRSELTERLPDAKTILEKMGGRAHCQRKFDGFRVQIHKNGNNVRLFSRNLEETTPMMPEIVAGVLSQVKAKTAILDSEALAYNPDSEEFLPFQETTKRRRKYDIEEMSKKLPLKAFVFDIMYLDGRSLVGESLVERMKKLKQAVSGDETLIPEPGVFTDSAEKIQELFDDAITKGLEGLIVKKPDSKYEAGARNFNWVKLKRHSAGELHDTIDCVILGYIFGKGKRSSFGAGSLLVGVYDEKKDMFVTVSKIGTGLTDIEWKEVHRRADKISVDKKPARVDSVIVPTVWIKPEIVIEVLADEITKSPTHTAGKVGDEPGFALRFPRLVRFRAADKRPEDATTVQELLEMYNMQYEHKKEQNK